MTTNYSDFRESLRYDENCDIAKLLKIQRELEQGEITKERIYSLTYNISEYEKNKIIQLYVNQIESLNKNINNYKNKIIKERRELKVT